MDWAVLDLSLSGVLVEISQTVLHPVLIITIGEIFMSVGA
jgi:hypothetical protein